jgi:flagellar biosynthesis/type III secretory pathway protein FliH
MQLIVISPETKPSHQHGIIDFLSLLFGENLDFTSSLQRLENEYGVILEKQEKEEMHKMCNWSIAHYQNGLEIGLEQGLQQGENNGILKEMKNTIQRMVHAGFNLEAISIATGKNIDEVKTLVQQLS